MKRAPLVDRKKRKLGEVHSSGQPDSTAAGDSGAKVNTEAAKQLAAPKVPKLNASAPKTSARALKKARKNKEGEKPAPNPKQQLVSTVALGGLNTANKAKAIAMAQAAGKVLGPYPALQPLFVKYFCILQSTDFGPYTFRWKAL